MVDLKSTENGGSPEQLPTETQQIAELTDTLKRLQAEFDNYRKRTESERSEERKRAAESVLYELLNIIDGFELALKQSDSSPFAQGIELVYAQLMQLLESYGIERISCETFDPRKHEALLVEPSEKPAGTILEVLQQGYSLQGKMVRNAKVKIAKEV